MCCLSVRSILDDFGTGRCLSNYSIEGKGACCLLQASCRSHRCPPPQADLDAIQDKALLECTRRTSKVASALRSGVAQLAEHSAVNRRVVGSSPTPRARPLYGNHSKNCLLRGAFDGSSDGESLVLSACGGAVADWVPRGRLSSGLALCGDANFVRGPAGSVQPRLVPREIRLTRAIRVCYRSLGRGARALGRLYRVRGRVSWLTRRGDLATPSATFSVLWLARYA
jgi:hypothetical protein